jgi:small subunit ribosomal protein S6e
LVTEHFHTLYNASPEAWLTLAQFKVVISDPKTGKSQSLEVKDSQAQIFLGKKIGETIDASSAGYSGKLKITGGSDRAGFPMRQDVQGGGKHYVLMSAGVGFRNAKEGEKKRKLVRGNIVTEEIFQVNALRTE